MHLGDSQPQCIVTDWFSCALEKLLLTYLKHTYLLIWHSCDAIYQCADIYRGRMATRRYTLPFVKVTQRSFAGY